MDLATCLTVLNIVEKGATLFDWFSGAKFGARADQALAERRRDDPNLIKVSDRIFVDTSVQEVRSDRSSSQLNDILVMRDLMEPVADSIDGRVLTSQILRTPPKLKAAFEHDPWSVLDNIRPMNRATADPRPDWIPIAFHEGDTEYVGWQKRGALPQLFDCEFDESQTRPGAAPTSPKPAPPRTGPHWDPARIKQALEHAFWPVMNVAGCYFAPDISESKLRNALSFHVIPSGERIIALFDTTVFGSANNAILFSTGGIYYRNGSWGSESHGSLSYLEFCAGDIGKAETYDVQFGSGHRYNTAGSSLLIDQIVVALLSFRSELKAALSEE